MALTGLQVFKLLPNTNCRKCGYPTCLAFAMKLAAGKESLDKCPDASEEARAALGAASAPPIRGVTIGRGERAITVGEETVFFRHEKTFVRRPGLFRVLNPSGMSASQRDATLESWRNLRIERAGESFQVDGVAILEVPGSPDLGAQAAAAAAERGLPVAVLAATPEGAAAMVGKIKEQRPLLVPPAGAHPSTYASLAASLGVPLVVSGTDLKELAAAALEATRAGVADILLEPPGATECGIGSAECGVKTGPPTATECGIGSAEYGVKNTPHSALRIPHSVDSALRIPHSADSALRIPHSDPRSLHHSLTAIRRGALDRIHPGLGHPVFLRVGAGEFEKGVLGITKFASLLAIEDQGGETWLPLWTLRQNIYTDPQKPLQMDAGVYPIGEPDAKSPLVVTTNFSLTYFVVSTELEATGLACHLAVVDAEGLSVLTAWSAGKFSGDRVAKALRQMQATERVSHRTAIIPGYVSVISGELEDALGEGWRVLVGPQEASDLAPFFRDVWGAIRAE